MWSDRNTVRIITNVNLTTNITEKITKNNQEKTATKPKIITIYISFV